MNPFAPEVIAAITGHMNHDHAEDTLVICRGVGGQPDATAATMDSFDGDGADFTATVADAPVSIHIAWDHPISQRAEVRPEIVRIFRESRDRLGLAD